MTYIDVMMVKSYRAKTCGDDSQVKESYVLDLWLTCLSHSYHCFLNLKQINLIKYYIKYIFNKFTVWMTEVRIKINFKVVLVVSRWYWTFHCSEILAPAWSSSVFFKPFFFCTSIIRNICQKYINTNKLFII